MQLPPHHEMRPDSLALHAPQFHVPHQINGPYVFDGDLGIDLHAMQGIGPHLTARQKYHDFSRVSAGTWCILSSYGGDDPSKFVFVQ